jgi:hypothetical protein
MCYSEPVVGRELAVDRVQTFNRGARQEFTALVLIEAGVVSGLFSFSTHPPPRPIKMIH